MDRGDLVLGVDCGGTLCRAALVLHDRRVETERPGANATSDFEGCVRALTDALATIAAEAGVAPADLAQARAHLAVAGVTDAALAARLAARLPLTDPEIEEDRRATLAGALDGGDGCVALCGTGSFLGRRARGETRFAGGHGLILGDEASGAWLGRSALAAALQALDGTAARSGLTDTILAEMGGKTAIIGFASQARPAAFAELAPRVVQATRQGDPVAVALMARGAAYIAHGVQALGRGQGEPLALMGGLGAAYAPWLPDDLRSCLVPPRGTALDGALALAAARGCVGAGA